MKSTGRKHSTGIEVKKSGKKQKKLSISKLKKELDRVFSIYIRTKYTNYQGYVQCYTCPKLMLFKESQNGHFVPRQYLATRFDERNCRPQCYACNMLYNGQPSTFALKLEQETPGIVQELDRLRHVTIKWYPYDYQEKIDFYKSYPHDILT